MNGSNAVTAGIIHYKDLLHVPACLEGLARQTAPVERVILMDNQGDPSLWGPLREKFPTVEFIVNSENLGYAGAANRIIAAARTPFVLLLNPDVVLGERFVEKALAAAASGPRVGIVGGKLVRPSGELDSAGIAVRRTRRMRERGQGEKDEGRYLFGDVFAVCGAAMLLRREMLHDVAVDGEWFDESFFVYHEDTDLCWRARLAGWRTCFTPDAAAVHHRGWGRDRSRRDVPRFVRVHSFKNHFLEMAKNEDLRLFLRDLPFILLWQGARTLWALVREPFLIAAYWRALRLLPAAWRKRRVIMARRRASSADLAPFFTGVL